MRLRYSRQAAQDLQDISRYIRTQNPIAARRVRAAIEQSLLTISAHPNAGRDVVGQLRKHAVPRYPYLIYYEIDEPRNEIGIVTIRHAARDQFKRET